MLLQMVFGRQTGAGGVYRTNNNTELLNVRGTSFSGGSGAASYAFNYYNNTGSYTAYSSDYPGRYAGKGASFVSTSGNVASYGGSGAGNPGGQKYSKAEDGTGGVIILIIHGKLTINLNGKIIANGSKGGNGAGRVPHGQGYQYGYGGCGSGGGSINIFVNEKLLLRNYWK